MCYLNSNVCLFAVTFTGLSPSEDKRNKPIGKDFLPTKTNMFACNLHDYVNIALK